jgi:hypothetical protein
LSKPYRSLWGRVGIFDLLLQSRPPLKKKNIGGGPPFTIVDVTLSMNTVLEMPKGQGNTGTMLGTRPGTSRNTVFGCKCVQHAS